ncbi:MAG: tRNA pseudouridine(55) synthase TruB, partial [Quisquiliibacterium sp.]
MNKPRAQRESIDGVLLIDKPFGMSSNDALIRVRSLLNARKAGHGGTLDPLATGLLPIAFGEATKFAADALDADKQYLAELTLGIVTDSGDAEGEVIRRSPVAVTPEQFGQTLREFLGQIEQVPPMHSALKRAGRPLYEYARAGVRLERESRTVQVDSLELIDINPAPGLPIGDPGSLRARIRVSCSKGTYIRT